MKNAAVLFSLLILPVVLAPQAAAERGGTISIGEHNWNVVPSIQCSVFPGNVVSIAGHAAGDESVEITIDFGGPDGVRVGEGNDAWHARKETIEKQIEGKRVKGTATFFKYTGKPEDARQGSFEVSCG